METSPLICSPNQWTGFYMIGTSVMKNLMSVMVLSNNVGGNFVNNFLWKSIYMQTNL